MDRYASESKGVLFVESVKDQVRGRSTISTRLLTPGGQLQSASPGLLDVELDWMSEERFSLSGFREVVAYADRPARLLHHGWLCEFSIEDPSADDSRSSRRATPVR